MHVCLCVDLHVCTCVFKWIHIWVWKYYYVNVYVRAWKLRGEERGRGCLTSPLPLFPSQICLRIAMSVSYNMHRCFDAPTSDNIILTEHLSSDTTHATFYYNTLRVKTLHAFPFSHKAEPTSPFPPPLLCICHPSLWTKISSHLVSLVYHYTRKSLNTRRKTIS